MGEGTGFVVWLECVMNSALRHLFDYQRCRVFGYVNAIADRQISSEFPCRSVLLEGNYHAPYAEAATGNGTMVLIGAVQVHMG